VKRRRLSPEDAEYLRRSCDASGVPLNADDDTAARMASILAGIDAVSVLLHETAEAVAVLMERESAEASP